jgi:hypothetical protein
MVSMTPNVKRLLDEPDTDSAATELPPWWWAAQGREQLTGHAADPGMRGARISPSA